MPLGYIVKELGRGKDDSSTLPHDEIEGVSTKVRTFPAFVRHFPQGLITAQDFDLSTLRFTNSGEFMLRKLPEAFQRDTKGMGLRQ